ncbi:MAG: bifunctional phosphopantothenoylcysteine decarboxylase/phosphopantothenate--cysteine ligase CoaBC [Cytophagales bacterium]|nr:MAG: bifunctional phosphopantothenoylcysteine decarboxylase/phosphopantothenate--cysteine ligase CoaBC [Cytophagales bacterium]
MQLLNKKILIGVSGSIAAYKIAHLIRLLVKEKAEVKVVMTASASNFITPLTLSTLSNRPVDIEFVKNNQGEWTNHVEWGLWADCIVLAPATANTIAKIAHGLSNNLLTAIVLSARCPVMIAPAMDLDMIAHPSTQNNFKILKSYGYQFIATNFGELASGLVGDGRMAEPEEILLYIKSNFKKSQRFSGKNILITAGPTQEAIDPVRFISNYSTGKMGYAIAKAAAEEGANVTLVSGPVAITIEHPNIKLIKVNSAQQMYETSMSYFIHSDVAILSAAVADYRPQFVASEKIKKKDADFTLLLEKTPDIALELGKIKNDKQTLVGFALETNNELENAQLKLQNKKLDFIVLNSMKDEGAGFAKDTNKITILDKEGNIFPFEVKDKEEVARDIIEKIYFRIENKS